MLLFEDQKKGFQRVGSVRRELILPSWLMTLDELMSLWLGQEGIVDGKDTNINAIPVASFVERSQIHSVTSSRLLTYVPPSQPFHT